MNDGKRDLIFPVHGILTRNTGTTWPLLFVEAAAEEIPGAVVIPMSYEAGPFPWWNLHVVNPRAARDLADTVKLFDPRKYRIHFVGHSNGCHVVSLALPFLCQYEIGSVMLVAGAMPRDIEATPIWRTYLSGNVRRFLALASKNDDALKLARASFYGETLGRNGFYFAGKPITRHGIIETLWFDAGKPITRHGIIETLWFDYNHSDYWSEQHFPAIRQVFYESASIEPAAMQPAALPSAASAGPACASSHTPVPARHSDPSIRVESLFT